jgi:uncharacterized coiled-coil DUF342 family protein
MEKKRMVVDLNQVDMLEQRVIKATEMIRALRRDRDAALAKLEEATASLARLTKETRDGERERRGLDEATRQLEVLQQERQAVRGKVQKMLDLMSCLDEAPVEARGDH